MPDEELVPCNYRSLVELPLGAAERINDLPADTEVTVRTASGSEYELYVLEPEARQVMISGGVFGEKPIEATINGAVLGADGGPLHCGWIKVGFSLEITFDSEKYAGFNPPVRTSPVMEILVNGRKLEPRKRWS